MAFVEPEDQRFRTAPPASVVIGGTCVVDSYTGLHWCGAGLHLLEVGKNATQLRSGGLRCRPCSARTTRNRRQRTVPAG